MTMPFRSLSATVPSDTATKIYAAEHDDLEVWIDGDQNETYFVGGPDVTTATGLRVTAVTTVFRTDVRGDDELWVICPGENGMTLNILVRSA